jgi:hypothetical protein
MYAAAATPSTALKDPNFIASHAAEPEHNIAETLEPVFMMELAVPPYRPPISTQVAQVTGNMRSCAPIDAVRKKMTARGL